MMLGSWREVNYRISLFRSIELMLMWCVSVCGGGVAGVYWNECAGIPLADSIVSSFAVARQAKYVAKMSLGVKRSRERSSRRRSDMWGSCSLMLCSRRPPPAQPFARLSKRYFACCRVSLVSSSLLMSSLWQRDRCPQTTICSSSS